MLNSALKKEAIATCEQAGKAYKKSYDTTIADITRLHEKKEKAVAILKDVEKFIFSIANKPKEFEKIISTIRIRRIAFEEELKDLKIEAAKVAKVTGSVAGAGVTAGVGVAAFGPSAAMAIATTFGTASTGTAIASLSGAAATNAALAWLGGGALAAGGGGMTAGSALLAMAGPVGWGIGGAAIIGGGLMASAKNKKIAEKANKQTRELRVEKRKMDETDVKVKSEIDVVEPLNKKTDDLLQVLSFLKHSDYRKLDVSDRHNLAILINSSESLSQRIGVKIA